MSLCISLSQHGYSIVSLSITGLVLVAKYKMVDEYYTRKMCSICGNIKMILEAQKYTNVKIAKQ